MPVKQSRLDKDQGDKSTKPRWSARHPEDIVKARRFILSGLLLAVTALALAMTSALAGTVRTPELGRFITNVAPADLAPGADGFGAIREDLPVAPILERGKIVGWAYLTSDFVGTTGYSGKPIHVLVGVSPEAVLSGVRLVEQAILWEPASSYAAMISPARDQHGVFSWRRLGESCP